MAALTMANFYFAKVEECEDSNVLNFHPIASEYNRSITLFCPFHNSAKLVQVSPTKKISMSFNLKLLV